MKNYSKIHLFAGLIVVSIVILQAVLLVTGVQAANNPNTVTIGYQAGADDKNLVLAQKWFEKELAQLGIKLKYVQFNAGRDINNAFAAGSIDFGDLGDPPATIGITRGIPYEIYWLHNLIGESEALAVKNSSNIKSVKDLVGKRVATTISSTAHYSLLSALKLEGIDPKGIRIIDLNPADIVAAWQRGDIDAAYTWQPNLSKLLNDGILLLTSRHLAAKGAPTSNIGVVRKEFGGKYPHLVALYIKQLIRAQEYYKKNPQVTAEILAKTLTIDKAEAAKQAGENIWLTGQEQLSPKVLGTSKQKGDFAKNLKAIADFLVEQKALDSAGDLSKFENAINPKYLELALGSK